MDPFFKELGDAVLKRWKKENFSLAKFPQIARAALDARPPAKHVDLAVFMCDFLLSEEYPPQTDSPFGEPEIVAYSHSRFYIHFVLDGRNNGDPSARVLRRVSCDAWVEHSCAV